MQVVGTFALALALAALGLWPTIESGAIPWAFGLSVLGVVSLFMLYRGLALGPIAVVSPVVSSYSAIAVILIVIVLGERLSVAKSVAVAVVFLGVLLSTTDIRAVSQSIRRPLPGVPIALIATLGFGVWSTLLAAATRYHDGIALILLWRAISVALLLPVVVLVRPRLTGRGVSTWLLVVMVGVMDTLANVAFVLGVRSGSAALTATGSGLYPILPALLGIVWLGERLAPSQYLGIALLIAGLAALGSS